MRLYVGLVHYPVYNRNRERIASAITTVDIHDLSRVARTYGVKRFYVVTPLTDQRRLVGRILAHWKVGFGATYNPHRKEALDLVTVFSSLEEAVVDVGGIEGERPLLIATDAQRREEGSISYGMARQILRASHAVLLLFGTAWGLDREILERADYVLEPIIGVGRYNHLSVRTAAAITLDRLAGGQDQS
ncbi:MAG: RNA methyltransferase [Deltaproteobacteria bacterium]|nr:RNA methyltransferase [Deltaproteobacteria bacterium]